MTGWWLEYDLVIVSVLTFNSGTPDVLTPGYDPAGQLLEAALGPQGQALARKGSVPNGT